MMVSCKITDNTTKSNHLHILNVVLQKRQQSEMKQCLCPLTLVDVFPPEVSYSIQLYVTLDSLMDRPVLHCIPWLSKCIFNILLCFSN